MKESLVEFCPVPDEQLPVHEYQALRDAWLFSWVTLEPMAYSRKLFWVEICGLMIATPIAWASFPPHKQLLNLSHLILGSIGGAALLVIAIVVHLYMGWSYICNRLNQEQVAYEESGWYDGQIWVKPEVVIQRDRLIVTYQINPILRRLRQTALILGILYILGAIIWLIT